MDIPVVGTQPLLAVVRVQTRGAETYEEFIPPFLRGTLPWRKG